MRWNVKWENILVILQRKMYMLLTGRPSHLRSGDILDELPYVVSSWFVVTNDKCLTSCILSDSNSKFFSTLPDDLSEMKSTLVYFFHAVSVQLAFVVPFLDSVPRWWGMAIVWRVDWENVFAVRTVGSVG